MEFYFDLEKTLVEKESRISKYTYNALEKLAKNNACTILTTSPLLDAQVLISIPNLRIVSTLENKLFQDGKCTYTPLRIENLDALAFDKGVYTLYAICEKECYILKYKERLKSFYPTPHFIITTHFPKKIAAIQMVIYQKDLERISKKLESYHIDILASDRTKVFINLTSTPSTKESWILKLKKSPALGIGDSLSDYSFIKHCEVQVAMKNADDELKDICALHTTETYEEDGAIKFILSYLKHQQA